MKRIFPFLFLFISSFCFAQNYKYIGVDDGLSNRRVYSIQKDKKGYMWFLTHDGIDRFDGKQFKHYTLTIDGKDLNSFANLNQLHRDTTGSIWEIGKNGQIFRYNHLLDKYQFIGTLNEESQPHTHDMAFNFAHIDDNNNIWLCTSERQYIYNINNNKFRRIKNNKKQNINNIAQVNKYLYYIGTNNGIYMASLANDSLIPVRQQALDSLSIQVNALYYHKSLNKLVIGSFLKGVFIYDRQKKETIHVRSGLEDVSINCIRLLNDNEVLIATDGAGIYKVNLATYASEPYIIADYNQPNGMNGNNINDVLIDEEKRIWIANYPIGITILDERYPHYKWFKHAIGNKNSLINDQVNAIIEDSDGDIWFATNNGVSLYNVRTDTWTNILSSFHSDAHNKNHIFISLCEVNPGIVLVGGYTSGMYRVDKKDMRPTYFIPSDLADINMKPDKYIRSIYKDSKGKIWAGGYYNLKSIDMINRKIEAYPGISSINSILEKDSLQMWIGTTNGLYLLNKKSKESKQVKLPTESGYINTLYQDKKGVLYIGTSGSGMIVYNPDKEKFANYYKDNCALISNSIYTILSDGQDLTLSTENSLTRFDLKNKTFHNWTKEQGLMTNHFNATSGTMTRRNTFILGSGDGAVEFNKETNLPKNPKTQLIFSDFRLFYQTVHSGEKNSPLTKDINEMGILNLNYDQNIFSLRLSSINYDYPSNIIYSWKLEGFYNEWSRASYEALVRYTNLNPGEYKLRVRAIANEDQHVIEERSLDIVIHPPFWETIWAKILYAILFFLIAGAILRYYFMRKDRKISADKISFFINTAHDIRTPLTLIKAPLDELLDKETLSPEGEANLLSAIRSTNNLFRLISNLINFEKSDVYSLKLCVEEYELYSFLEESIKQFKSYAESKQVQLTYESNFRFLNVWFDKGKMDSILKNLISNAIKYTPADGSVRVIATSNTDNWSIEVRDTGIGIPPKEQKKLFKMFFRGSNAINLKVSGSGIGLLLVKRLVRSHKGTITLKSALNMGSSFKVTFRHGNKHFRKDQFGHPEQVAGIHIKSDDRLFKHIPFASTNKASTDPVAPRLLIVEDNDELRDYLQRSLSERYTISLAANGKEALEMLKNVNPHLIISDIMMPEMRGDELCAKLKNDIETSHIPIILLTALSDKDNIISGLATKADRYLTKPFDIAILKAVITNLLENRALLKEKFASLELSEPDCTNCSSELDYKFMEKVKENIEKNMDKPNFNVDHLCAALNMSRSSFYNKIKALTDQAPADFIRVQRLNRAAKLLRTRNHTITEIADLTGFNDAKYFREVFKKHFNMTPSQYINQNE